MKLIERLRTHWERRQVPSVLCIDMELVRHLNYWLRFERIEGCFVFLLNSVPFVRDDFLEAFGYDSENNTFRVRTGSMGNKKATISLLPNRVIICPDELPGEQFEYRVMRKKAPVYHNGPMYTSYWLEEIK